jgi:hypothetical protein
MGGTIIAVLCIIGAMVWGIRAGKRRNDAVGMLAEQLGLSFSHERNYQLADRYAFLDKLQQGSNRYAHNILKGTYQGHEIAIFDYHYETDSTDADGKRQASHVHLSFFILTLEKCCPEQTLAKENFLSEIEKMGGTIEIDQKFLALGFDGRLKADEIEKHLNQLIEIYSLIPETKS